jgi:hypothetical protein
MLLDINLLHEEQTAMLERQRDPLKLGMLVVLLVALVLVVIYFYVSNNATRAKRELEAAQAELTKLKPIVDEAAIKEPELKKRLDAMELLRRSTQERFLAAPILELVLKSARADIQITSLAIKTNERVEPTLTIEGITVGFRSEPRTVSDDFRLKLEANVRKLYPKAAVQLQNVSTGAPVTLEGRQYPTAQFTIVGTLGARVP